MNNYLVCQIFMECGKLSADEWKKKFTKPQDTSKISMDMLESDCEVKKNEFCKKTEKKGFE